MLTPSYGMTATERVLPRMALDFTAASLDARVTVTRALNTATCVNSSGLITLVNADLPRFDYDPVSLQCKGLLIESSRGNGFSYSEDIGNGVWTKTRSSISSDAATAPDGATTADKLVEDNTAANWHGFFRSFTTTNGVSYSPSIFVKAGERTQIAVQLSSGAGAFAATSSVIVNLSTGAIVSSSGTVAVSAYKDGWYRITTTNTAIASAACDYIVRMAVNGDVNYNGNGSSGVYVWGAQREDGLFSTSYIPATGNVGVTRNADVVTMTSTNFSSWWQANIGGVSATGAQISVSGTCPWLQFDDTTANNIIALQGNTTNPELYVKATTDQAQIDAGTIAANTTYGLAAAWATDSCAAALSGAAAVTDTSATIPVVTQARLGSDGTNYLNGWLKSIRYWPQRITNSETQAFSKL